MSYELMDLNKANHWDGGLNSMAKENTARAFCLAGQYGFYGCECDIWETKSTTKVLCTKTASDINVTCFFISFINL